MFGDKVSLPSLVLSFVKVLSSTLAWNFYILYVLRKGSSVLMLPKKVPSRIQNIKKVCKGNFTITKH